MGVLGESLWLEMALIMARKKNKTLKRKVSSRTYRDVCWVSTEGQTEKDYLSMDIFKSAEVVLKFPQDVHPARRNPMAVLKRFEKALRQNDFRKNDEAWLMIDIDEWDISELDILLEWENKDSRYHLAISNPKFELFLLFHFEKGSGCTTATIVDDRIKRFLPRYKKRLKTTQFNYEDIVQAIENAREKRKGCKRIIPYAGMGDVYKLVERLLPCNKSSLK